MKILEYSRVRKQGGAIAPAGPGIPREVMEKAQKIFDQVAEKGDPALFDWTWRLEKHRISNRSVKVSAAEIEKAVNAVPGPDLKVMRTAAKRIREYHKKQKVKGVKFDDKRGVSIEERVAPLQRAGICIPGGRAPLASTVLMTAIPARLARVEEVVMISPWPQGNMNPHVLAAARIARVDAVYKIGGVQGVAALACGTRSMPRVDKIVGPGSVWVTAGKAIAASRGLCGVDSLAGPSEVMVVADKGAKARWVALDLISQAEHGEDSTAVLVTTSKTLAKDVKAEVERLLETSGAETSLEEMKERIKAVVVGSLDQAARFVNQSAPEHLEIMVASPHKFARKIKNAASVFIGPYSPVPAGDYMAGANHVLPTGGTARFSSPLGVYDFVKRQSLTRLTRDGLATISYDTARFAEIEGLVAHMLSILVRFPPKR